MGKLSFSEISMAWMSGLGLKNRPDQCQFLIKYSFFLGETGNFHNIQTTQFLFLKNSVLAFGNLRKLS